MGLVVDVPVVDGNTVTAASANARITAILAQLNGNLDADNAPPIAAGYVPRTMGPILAPAAVPTGAWGDILPNKEHTLIHASARLSVVAGSSIDIDLQKSVNAGTTWTSMFNPAVATISGTANAAGASVPVSIPLAAAQQVCAGQTWLRVVTSNPVAAPANLSVTLTFKVIHGTYNTSV